MKANIIYCKCHQNKPRRDTRQTNDKCLLYCEHFFQRGSTDVKKKITASTVQVTVLVLYVNSLLAEVCYQNLCLVGQKLVQVTWK